MQAEAGVPTSPVVLWSGLKVTNSSCHSQLQRGMSTSGGMSSAGQHLVPAGAVQDNGCTEPGWTGPSSCTHLLEYVAALFQTKSHAVLGLAAAAG